MSTIKKRYNTVVSQAKKGVPGFAIEYAKFIEKVTINQSSKTLIVNYSRSLAYVVIEFKRCPHKVSVEELNTYLYRTRVHKQCSLSYFKHAVFALRYWFASNSTFIILSTMAILLFNILRYILFT